MVIFTSAFAVTCFFRQWRVVCGTASCADAGLQFVAVGPATAAELSKTGIQQVLEAKVYSGDGVADLLTATFPLNDGPRFLVPRAKHGVDAWIERLRHAGAEVLVYPVYETVPIAKLSLSPPDHYDWVCFLSPSAVTGFANVSRLADGARVACIGPTTAAKAEKLGFEVSVVAAEHTVPGLVAAMVNES